MVRQVPTIVYMILRRVEEECSKERYASGKWDPHDQRISKRCNHGDSNCRWRVIADEGGTERPKSFLVCSCEKKYQGGLAAACSGSGTVQPTTSSTGVFLVVWCDLEQELLQ